MSLPSRLARIEAAHWAALPPLDRARARIARDDPATLFADDELTAYVLHAPELAYMRALPHPLIHALAARLGDDTESCLLALQAAYADGSESFSRAIAHAQSIYEGSTA
jgi:hypothetical protein